MCFCLPKKIGRAKSGAPNLARTWNLLKSGQIWLKCRREISRSFLKCLKFSYTYPSFGSAECSAECSRTLLVAMNAVLKIKSFVCCCQMSFDDTDNDFNDMVLVILRPRSLTAAAPQCVHTFYA